MDAASLALFEVADQSLELLPRDTASPRDGARVAAEVAASEGARLFLGPLFASDVSAAAPVATARGINMIAFSNDRTVAGPGTYLIGVTPDEQIRRIVSYAATQGLRRFAALAPEGEYGRRVHEALRRVAAERGVELVGVSYYAADGSDLDGVVRRLARFDERRQALERERRELEGRDDEASREALRRLARAEGYGELGFEALVIPEGPPRLQTIAPLLAYYDMGPDKVRLLGLAAWESPGGGLGREPALVGAWYAAPPQGGAEGFAARFRGAYGRAPHPIARLAYDATALAALLARRNPQGPDYSTAALTSPSGYLGASGIFRFRPSGEAEVGLAVYEVRRDGVRVLAPAPETFTVLGN
jgi:ABC-type branched-subunit amino acid transport system substrate-binding protein